VGALIWDLLATPTSLTELHERMAAHLVDTPGSVDADLREFLQHLVERGLVSLG
jgi:hypothetical protein